MATAWVTLPSGRKFDWGTATDNEPQLDIHNFGGGFSGRFTRSLNNDPGVVKVVYNNLTEADWLVLRAYIKTNNKGQNLSVPLYHEKADGSITGNFFIVSYSHSADFLHSVTITMQQIYTTT